MDTLIVYEDYTEMNKFIEFVMDKYNNITIAKNLSRRIKNVLADVQDMYIR